MLLHVRPVRARGGHIEGFDCSMSGMLWYLTVWAHNPKVLRLLVLIARIRVRHTSPEGRTRVHYMRQPNPIVS